MLGIKKPLKILDPHNYELWEPEGASQKDRRGRGMKICTTSLIYMVL